MRWFDFAGASGYRDHEKSCGSLYYYGARYYDARTSVWLSLDPMAEKYPNESPFIYTSNNPIIYIDPDGEFKIPIHKRIIENAFNQSGLSKGWMNFFMEDVKLGVSVEADILGAAFDFHFDGRKNFTEVQKTWDKVNSNINSIMENLGSFNRELGGNDAILFGRALHTVQDFYSHSNYVELYIEYYKGANNGTMPTDVPIYDEGVKNTDFKKILEKKLRTGDFDIIDNEFTNPTGEKAQQPTSHNKMNKDKANTPAARLAEKVATKHTAEIMKKAKKKSDD